MAANIKPAASTALVLQDEGGTDVITISTAGNVGVGNGSPTQKLDVTGNINASGALTLGTALAIAEGGTGATSASAARTALGLEIGTDVEAYDADTTKNDVANTFTANQIISANSSSDALRITQTGSGNALVVEDSANPDSTPFVVDNAGFVLKGHYSALTTDTYSGIVITPVFQLHGTSIASATLAVTSWYDTATSAAPSQLVLSRNGGGTVGTHAPVDSGDVLGAVVFNGSDGSNFISSASITATCDGTPGTDDMPGRLVFSTTADGASSPTERMRIDSSGNVGIGTSSPGQTVEINYSGTGNNYAIRTVNTSTSAGARSGIQLMLSNGSEGAKIYTDSAVTADSPYNLNIASTQASASIVFGTGSSSTERMRIDSSGNVGIGVTSISYQLQLSTDSAGKPSTTTWTVVSDERIKEQIELADLDLCYDAVKNIPLKRFKWRDEVYSEKQVPDRHKLGWIAQDVEAIYPKAVSIHEFKYNQIYNETIIPAVEEELDEEGNVITEAQEERIEKELVSEDVIEDCRDLNADQIYAAMYGAIQKLIQKVESQQSTIHALTARIEALEATP